MNNKTNFLIRFLQKYGCNHDYKFVCNIYGDEINKVGGYRSIWECNKCGHIQYREDLHKPNELYEELNKLYNAHYKNKYKNWCTEHFETLESLTNQMLERANSGYDYLSIILIIDSSTDDKYYYEKWFTENELKFSYESTKTALKIKQYRYTISW